MSDPRRNIAFVQTSVSRRFHSPRASVGLSRWRGACAVLLLFVSLGLGTVTSDLMRPHLGPAGRTLLVQIVTLALLAWLSYEIWVGRNWARITSALLWALGLVFYVPVLIRLFQASAIVGSINLIQSLLQLAAFYLLFTNPGRAWFKTSSPVA